MIDQSCHVAFGGLASCFVRTLFVLLSSLVLILTACGGGAESPKRAASTAVVIVSGGDATSPFTTADQACATGLAAGNTDTALREYLLDQGYAVYTSPAMAGRGQVVDQTGFGAFGVCPVTLPENMTVNSTGSIDTAGEHLARFLNWLHTDKGVNEVDFVAHSMGGLYSRAAIRVLTTTNSPVKVRSLTTIGTPWQGSYLSDYANGLMPLTDCLGDKLCESGMKDMADEVKRLMAGSAREVNQAFLMGKNGWNEFQSGVLDKIPVVLIAGQEVHQGRAGSTRRCGRMTASSRCRARWPATSATRCCRTGAATSSTTPTASTCPTSLGWTGRRH